jgi:hypothetical protein
MKSRSSGLGSWKRELRCEHRNAYAAPLQLSAGTALLQSFLSGSHEHLSTLQRGIRQLPLRTRDSTCVAASQAWLSSAMSLLVPMKHGIGTCAHLRSYEIHHMGGADSFKPDSRRINECITTKRTASVKCLHPEQQIQSEILSATPTTSTSEGIRHEARDCHVMAAGLCKALGVAWEKESSADRNFPFKWAPTSVLSKLQSRVCCMYRSNRWELTRQEQLTVRGFTNQTLDT